MIVPAYHPCVQFRRAISALALAAALVCAPIAYAQRGGGGGHATAGARGVFSGGHSAPAFRSYSAPASRGYVPAPEPTPRAQPTLLARLTTAAPEHAS